MECQKELTISSSSLIHDCCHFLENLQVVRELYNNLQRKKDLLQKKKKPFVALQMDVPVDISEAAEISCHLAELIIGRPQECSDLFQELLFAISKIFVGDWSPENASEILLKNIFPQTNPGPSELKSLEGVISHCVDSYNPLTFSVSTRYDLATDHCLPPEDDLLLQEEDAYSMFVDDDRTKCSQGFPEKKMIPSDSTPNFEMLDSDFLGDLILSQNGEGGNKMILTSKSQICVRLHIEGLPFLPPWALRSHFCIAPHQVSLGIVSGIVSGLSISETYTVWVQWRCSSSCVPSSSEVHVSTTFTELEDKICRFCLSPLSEDPSTREEGEQATFTLLPDLIRVGGVNNKCLRVTRALTLVVRDSEQKLINLGDRIEATVFLYPSKDNESPFVYVSKVYPPLPVRMSPTMPKVFRQLVKDRSSSPWSLVLTFAYMFCSHVSPPGTFHRLKMALLLSLVSCSTQKNVLAVLAVGKNDWIQNRLLKCAAEMAPRSVIHSSLNEFEGKCVTKHVTGGSTWIEAGSLLRAKGGVCVVENLATIKKEIKSAVCEVLENEKIHIEIATQLKGPSHSVTYRLRTCVWSTYNPCYKKKRNVEADDFYLHVPVGDLTKSVTDVFGLIVYSDSCSSERDEEAEASISSETLSKEFGDASFSKPLLPKEELIQYLDLVRSTEVTFTKEAEDMLRGYYVSNRRLRGDCKQGSVMPVTAINTLTKVAQCHAKLALRKTVEVADAATAVLMCEEALTARFGHSPLGVTPSPHLSPHQDLHTLLGRKNDEKMINFIQQLKIFISEHTADVDHNSV